MKKSKYLGSCWTNGKGYWTKSVRFVPITKLELTIQAYHDDPRQFGELRVYFDAEYWQVGWSTTLRPIPGVDGLIYTDPQWIKEFRLLLKAYGFGDNAINDVDYSEQGMQGDDYVSLDAGRAFIFECDEPLIKFLKKNKKGVVKVMYDRG